MSGRGVRYVRSVGERTDGKKRKSNKHCDNNASHVVFRSVIVI